MSRNREVFGDPSSPANATLELKHSVGRVLRGVPLALAVFMRHLLLAGWEELGAPEFMDIRDRTSGKRIAKICLGRDPEEAFSRREAMESDLALLGRAQFLERYARGR